MARPVKLGLDYFPTDTDILKNIKIRKLIRKYRELGFVLYLQLLTDIYRNSFFFTFIGCNLRLENKVIIHQLAES